jgi:hypothetical protein
MRPRHSVVASSVLRDCLGSLPFAIAHLLVILGPLVAHVIGMAALCLTPV